VEAAIKQEVEARQQQRIRGFAADLEKSDIRSAVIRAEAIITENGRSGRAGKVDSAKMGDKYIAERKLGGDAAISATIEQIQNFHYKDAPGGNLSSKQIAENFKKNGSNFHAAQIAIALLEASHDHIRANEMNGATPDHTRDARSPAQKPAPARPRVEYDERPQGSYGR
jgi:hypothetical protein